MLIKVTTQSPMQVLLRMLETQQPSVIMTTLQCCFSITPSTRASQDEMVLVIKDVIGDHQSHLFMCADGDIFIVWHGGSVKTINAVKKCIKSSFSSIFSEIPDEVFFRYFDFRAHGEELRIACRRKIDEEDKNKSPSTKILFPTPIENDLEDLQSIDRDSKENKNFIVRILDKQYIQVDDEFFKIFNSSRPFRLKRRRSKFLIIEDQAFAGRLLARIISEIGDILIAPSGTEGLFLYAMYAPDIVFIDINLPDSTGHQLAEFIHTMDKDAYIVMVTANHSNKDIEEAVKNRVHDYIAKPYTLQKS